MKVFRLKDILDQRSISGKDFANDLGVTEATVSNLNKGEAIPRKDLLIKIARTLDVDIPDLFLRVRDQTTNELIDEAMQLLERAKRGNKDL